MSNLTPYAANVLSVYYRSTPEARSQGFSWYREANALANTLDPLNPTRAAGVIAALSPLTPWGRNEILAIMAYSNGGLDGGTLRNSIRKVNAMLREDKSPHDLLTSEKVGNFFRNIADPTHADHITIDRHAFDIAVGYSTNDDARRILSNKGIYKAFQRVYADAANAAGILPLDMQAITWVQWRNEKGLTADGR